MNQALLGVAAVAGVAYLATRDGSGTETTDGENSDTDTGGAETPTDEYGTPYFSDLSGTASGGMIA